MSTKEMIKAVTDALSRARMGTFETAVGISSNSDPRALALYSWNARVSAALLAPLHICEVVLRNAVSDAIEVVYGPRWPWQIGFEQSLPAPRTGYNPQRDLQNARSRVSTTGKVIPELKFVFWQRCSPVVTTCACGMPCSFASCQTWMRPDQFQCFDKSCTTNWRKFEACGIASPITSRSSPEGSVTTC